MEIIDLVAEINVFDAVALKARPDAGLFIVIAVSRRYRRGQFKLRSFIHGGTPTEIWCWPGEVRKVRS